MNDTATTPAPSLRLSDDQFQALQRLATRRHGLYKMKGGYGPTGGVAVVSPQMASRLIKRGLAKIDETGGNDGSLKITDLGLEAVALGG